MVTIRPRRRFVTAALALDAPLPIVVTCAGMNLSWPKGGYVQPEEDEHGFCPNCRNHGDACTCPMPPRFHGAPEPEYLSRNR